MIIDPWHSPTNWMLATIWSMYFLFYSIICFRCFQARIFPAWSDRCGPSLCATFLSNYLGSVQLCPSRMFANFLVESDETFVCLSPLSFFLWLIPGGFELWFGRLAASCTWPCGIPDFFLSIFLRHFAAFCVLLGTSGFDWILWFCLGVLAVLSDGAISLNTFLRYLTWCALFGLLFFLCRLFFSSFCFLLFPTSLFCFSVLRCHFLLFVCLFCSLTKHTTQHPNFEISNCCVPFCNWYPTSLALSGSFLLRSVFPFNVRWHHGLCPPYSSYFLNFLIQHLVRALNLRLC